MSENPAEVRLVRCPKCQNLLPEVTDYAVYQCGGCGAVLRENPRIGSGMSGDESDVISNKMFKESDFSNKSVNINKMSLGSENGVKSYEKDNSNNIEFEEPKPVFGSSINGSRRSVQSSNWRYHNDHQEGSSSYNYTPRHEYANLVQEMNDLEVDDDRAELLRKLDELKYEIVRSRDKSKEQVQAFSDNLFRSQNHRTHSLMANPNQVFTDPFRSQNHRRNPVPVLPFEQPQYHPYYPGQYVSNEMSQMTDNNRVLHHPSCTCLVCYNKLQQPQPPPPPVHNYNRRFSSPSLNSEPLSRWSNEIRRPPRGILAAGARRCRPVSGGSPFVTCCTCHELLQVPNKKVKKIRCASCDEVMTLSVINKRLVLSVYKETKKDKVKDDEKSQKTHGHATWGGTFSSEDYENNSGNFDFESMDRMQSGGPGLDEIKVNIILDENPADVAVNANANANVNVNKPSPPPVGSPLQDHFDYSTKYNRNGKGNVSRRSEMGREEKGGSMKDAAVAVASEIEISSNEYIVNTGTSQESGDTSRGNGNGSHFVGRIKKSFREFSKSSQSQSQHVDQEQVNVRVNGVPVPDRLVKKAEKLAGPVMPGDYWYDPRAGFWGMMGGSCRGIIPPFIEEFNHPMPERCGDGNTNVFVNGRELHQRDLDLLVSRGLPSEADRSYVIEISGRVLDEYSGLELEGLGKLAPTVERNKKGFGMKPPRTADA